MAPPKKAVVNSKQESGRAKKAENESKMQAAADAQRSAQEEKEWSQGANVKRSAKEQEAALREEEAARKRREKAQLLAAEEADGPSTTSTAKKALQSAKKTKKKDDLSFLQDSLVSAADKKSRQKKEAEAAAKLKAEREAQQKVAAAAAAAAVLDPLLANTQRLLSEGGISLPSDRDDSEISAAVSSEVVGRNANKARMELVGESGIDAALGTLTLKKVTYADFEERMLPVVKAEQAGLRLSQYKERVYNLWKKSPENPVNQPTAAATPAAS
jgi:Coiled-coil domain-containing protein 124 /Oxs1